MVMFKTSKLRLTEKKHLHADEAEQMSSLESVKVRRRRAKRSPPDRRVSPGTARETAF